MVMEVLNSDSNKNENARKFGNFKMKAFFN